MGKIRLSRSNSIQSPIETIVGLSALLRAVYLFFAILMSTPHKLTTDSVSLDIAFALFCAFAGVFLICATLVNNTVARILGIIFVFIETLIVIYIAFFVHASSVPAFMGNGLILIACVGLLVNIHEEEHGV